MNAKEVLNRILTLLSVDKGEETLLTYAKLLDGTIVESPTFDVDEPVEIVSEDGTKSPAPDGEHELVLRDESGNDVRIKIIVKDGKIAERENVELPEAEDEEEMKAETVEAKPIPSATVESDANKVPDIQSPADNDKGLKTSANLAIEEELPSGDGIEEEAEPLPGEEGSPFDMKAVGKKVEEMAYRIEELEKKIAAMEDIKEIPQKEEVMEEVEETEVGKLDGAPIEEQKFASQNKVRSKNKIENPQNSFLSKLYN